MRSYRYLHLDVFTDRRFGGNQLAVFLDGRGLTDADMQAIAKEMNYSESTFVLPPEAGHHFRVRIFTPAEELPMAGHPTIGTAFALAATGAIAPADAAVVFGLGAGPTPIELTWQGASLRFAWMTQLPPTFGPALTARAEVARSLGLTAGDLVNNLPVQVVTTGVPYVLVPLDSRAVVDRALFEPAAYVRFQEMSGLPRTTCVYPFSIESASDGATAYARMFGPGLGISEDPATGSAAGPLGAYLVEHGLLSGSAAANIRVLQGVFMGRPSDISVSVQAAGGRVAVVRVGGTAVLAGEGTLYL